MDTYTKKSSHPYQGQLYFNIEENETYIFFDGFWIKSYNFLLENERIKTLKKERIEKIKKLNEQNS